MTKKELRIRYKGLRSQLSESSVSEKSLLISAQVLKLPIWTNHTFHVFLPIVEKREVDTSFLLKIFAEKNKEVIISKSDFETMNMSHYIMDEEMVIVRNKYGIPEPVDGKMAVPEIIDVVFVPLLAFDSQGHRIGYGKGFYDRFLSQCRQDVIKIGLSFFEVEQSWDDIHESDIKMDYCVTPEKIYDFNQELQKW